MPFNLPPLPDLAATAIVRQAENAGKDDPNKQADDKKKDDARDAMNASIRRKNEPGNK